MLADAAGIVEGALTSLAPVTAARLIVDGALLVAGGLPRVIVESVIA